jgi:hypothetical protein
VRETYKNVEVLRKTPARGSWRAAYAVRGENGRAKIEEERISVFALCEDEGADASSAVCARTVNSARCAKT